nr:DEAD/DEAH box helicase [Salidesulfovibrio brasiliensis]
MTFTQFSFDSRIEAGIKSCGYSAPTPIQNQTIPFVLEGRDVMGLAQTGTGKTAAFALPILQRLLNKKSDKKGPSVLVLAPTRELALQIRESFAELGSRTGINSCSIIGGVGMNPQIKAFHRSKVVIACPGRLLGHIRNGDISLKGIDTLVLDEADRMLDMGFMPDIKRIIAQLPAKRQNLLFSATMPKDIQVFAKRILVDHEVVKVDPKAPVTSIKHVFHKTQKSRKAHILNDILKRDEHQNMLVFTRTKHLAKRLAQKLSNSGYNSISLQGNMSQAQRQKA